MKQVLTLFFLTALIISTNAQNNVKMEINQNAAVIQSKEIHINASPDKVWEVLVDINNWENWNEDISKSKINGSPKEKSKFVWKINGAAIKSEIHTVNPEDQFGWTGETFGLSTINNWYLLSNKNGTIVKVEESLEGLLAHLFTNK